jgi:hypothetical protein
MLNGKRKRAEAITGFYEWRHKKVQAEDVGSKSLCSFYEEKCNPPKSPLTSEYRFQVSQSSLYNAVKLQTDDDIQMILKDGPSAVKLDFRGRPPTLTKFQEGLICDALIDFEKTYNIITRWVLSNEALHMALMRRDDEELNDNDLYEVRACLRYVRVGGKDWIKGFLRRNPSITVSKKGRPIEKERAAKTQPEISVQHYRNLAHAYALCQIQRAITKGRNVSGWVLHEREGIVTRENGKGREAGRDVFEVKKVINDKGIEVEKIFIQCLNEELEPLNPDLVIALDEKPLYPDAPVGTRMSAVGVRHAVGCNRSSTWTLTPVITARGKLIHMQLITRGGSIATKLIAEIARDMFLCRTEKSIQTDDSFVDFAKSWIPKTSVTRETPGIVVVDGHSSHLTRDFSRLCMTNHIIPICEPSNLSILLQAGDNGVNSCIDKWYAEEYTTTFANLRGAVTMDHRIEAIHRVTMKLRQSTKLIQHCFRVVSVTGVLTDCVGHWKPSDFALGNQYRDSLLPKVDGRLLKAIFSLEQLTAPWNSAIVLPEDLAHQIAPELHEKFCSWLEEEADADQQSRFRTSITAYQISRAQRTDEELAVRLWGPRMERKFEENHNYSHYKGRVNISIGRNLGDDGAVLEAENSHRKAELADQDNIRKEKEREVRDNYEEPLTKLFISLKITEKGRPVTKEDLKTFAIANSLLFWPIPFPKNRNRPEQIGSILALIQISPAGTEYRKIPPPPAPVPPRVCFCFPPVVPLSSLPVPSPSSFPLPDTPPSLIPPSLSLLSGSYTSLPLPSSLSPSSL